MKWLCLLLLLSAPAWAGLPLADPADPAWAQLPGKRVILYPQSTAPGGPGGAPLILEVRWLHSDNQLSLHLSWTDPVADMAAARATHRFADAVAVQFAPPGDVLPYIGMGEPGKPVDLWLWRAGQPTERLSAQGFGSLVRKSAPAPEARAVRTATGWAVVLRGEATVTAIAFAVWDGAEAGRAGKKRLSAWQSLTAQTQASVPKGDATRGARLYAEHGCAACHAPEVGVGPDLRQAGGIHLPDYLRRALAEPTAHLVPGYVALMPPVPTDAVEDLVAWLMTLK